ncbi:MAG: ion transporter [Candidatus Heimdallarchaeota archaeon]|nr:ion transporter [Candidatus Heimdallarchaeota archaeon]
MKLLKRAFVEIGSPLYMRVNNFFALITLISVLFIVLETVDSMDPYLYIFKIIEWVTVILFTLEYSARLIAEKRKLKYILSFYGLVDLISVLPTYFGLANLSFLKVARITRILRFLRMVRLVKMMRVKNGKSGKDGAKEVQRLSIQIYILTLTMTVLIFGTLIYLVEGNNPAFENIPLGMLWAAKLTLGGISQVTPETIWGEIVSVGTRFAGLLLFGLLIHIVGKFFEKMLLGSAPIE